MRTLMMACGCKQPWCTLGTYASSCRSSAGSTPRGSSGSTNRPVFTAQEGAICAAMQASGMGRDEARKQCVAAIGHRPVVGQLEIWRWCTKSSDVGH